MPIHFGKYILLDKVGTGGMAELFMAKQTGLKGFEKMMVIKRILPHLSGDQEFVSMFINEAKLAALLTHENIVQIFDLGHIENVYFIAMEYVMGKDLRTILHRAKALNRPISVDHALLMVSKICAGLDYAHRKKDLSGRDLNLVHRDVSPQNILVSYDGAVKLVDFGIAKAATQSSETATGILKGKLAYMAPEQAWGRSIDHRADIFAMGIVLYEVLTGRKLFKGDNEFKTLERVREAKVEPLPSTLNKKVTPELEQIILKALAKDAKDRFQTASDFQAALEDHIALKGYSFSTVRLTQYMKTLFEHDMEEDSKRFHSGNGGGSQTATMEISGPSGAPRRPDRTPSHPSRQTRLALTKKRRRLRDKKTGVSAFWFMVLTMGIVLGSSVALARINPPFMEKLTRSYPPFNLAVHRLALWPTHAKNFWTVLGESLQYAVGGNPASPTAQSPEEMVDETPPQKENFAGFGNDEERSIKIETVSSDFSTSPATIADEPKRVFTPEEKQEIRELLDSAKLAYSEGKLAEVEGMLHLLINLNPTIPVTYHLLGTVRKEQKDPEGALRIFAEASRRFPDDARLHYDLGFLYFKQGVDSLAKDALQQGVRLDPESPMATRARKALGRLGVNISPPPLVQQMGIAEEPPTEITAF